ncbi:hypothetical protein [Agromyces sp. NPDC058126]|uniref:hypothetical protein n=1 Tax=Agromyces sp. NPDC058126 TaxID=3346350 RepID=UPI0036D8F400
MPTDELMGMNFASGLADLQSGISSACGGAQCVSVTKVGLSLELEDGTVCDTIREVEGSVLNPPPESGAYVDVPAGGNIVVFVNVRCEDLPPGDEDVTPSDDPEGDDPQPSLIPAPELPEPGNGLIEK